METFLTEITIAYYGIFAICGGIALAITLGGGWLIVKGLESLKSDNEE